MGRRRCALREMTFAKQCGVGVIEASELIDRRCRGAQFGEQACDVGLVSRVAEHRANALDGDGLEAVPEVDTHDRGPVGVRPGERSGRRPGNEPARRRMRRDALDQTPEQTPLGLSHPWLRRFDDTDAFAFVPSPDAIVPQRRTRRSQPPSAVGEPLEFRNGEIEPVRDLLNVVEIRQIVEHRSRRLRFMKDEGPAGLGLRMGPRRQRLQDDRCGMPGFVRREFEDAVGQVGGDLRGQKHTKRGQHLRPGPGGICPREVRSDFGGLVCAEERVGHCVVACVRDDCR